MKGLEMDFAELLEMLRNPGEDGVPDTIYDDLSASYTDSTSTRDAKIGETEAALAEALAEIARVKAMNYDLMIAAAVPEESGNEQGNNDTVDSTDDDDDDFFTDKD